MTKIITITGDLGSGKSTVSAILCRELNYGYVYTGEIQRRIAARYHMTTTELNRYAETHPEIDEEIDGMFRSLSNAENLIVDSRLAWFFIPNSFKVYLKTNLMVSAERITGDTRRQSETYASATEAARQIVIRKSSENKRYAALYGADCSNPNHFNLIIDTSFITPNKAADIILAACAAGQPATLRNTVSWISPKNVYPTQSAALKCGEETAEYDNRPVTLTQVGSFDYILDGHLQTSRALRNNVELIPAVYRDEPSPPVSQELFTEWEDFHAFKFLIYPQTSPSEDVIGSEERNISFDKGNKINP